MKPGDLVSVEPRSGCNPHWGSARDGFFTGKRPTLGVVLENRLEWYQIMLNDGRSGWVWFREVKPL
jgi:hypothetical protein